MNPVLIRAVVVVTFALIAYTIGVITEQRKHMISRRVLAFFTLGIVLDVSSTVLMIIGSGKLPVTIHGFIGYSALSVMLVDTILIWRWWRNTPDKEAPKGLNLYTRIAYGWWVLAYVAGAVIAITLK
jgi:uncharacterized repeat protein (TIGR03987 family)